MAIVFNGDASEDFFSLSCFAADHLPPSGLGYKPMKVMVMIHIVCKRNASYVILFLMDDVDIAYQ